MAKRPGVTSEAFRRLGKCPNSYLKIETENWIYLLYYKTFCIGTSISNIKKIVSEKLWYVLIFFSKTAQETQKVASLVQLRTGQRTKQFCQESSSSKNRLHLKSDNLQYNTLGRWIAGTNDSSTKRLMFQVLFFLHNFLQNSLQKLFQFNFLFF